MQPSRRRRDWRAGGPPTIDIGIVSAAAIELLEVVTTPNDHVAAGPHCRMRHSAFGRIGEAGGPPAVVAGIVSAASVKRASYVRLSAPDNHFASGPDCRVRNSRIRRGGSAGRYPTVGDRIVFSARA